MRGEDIWTASLDHAYDGETRAEAHGIESRMTAVVPFTLNGTQYSVWVYDWQLGDDLSESRLFKLGALGCWFMLPEEEDEAQRCYEAAAWDAVEAAWKAGDYMTDDQIDEYNKPEDWSDYDA